MSSPGFPMSSGACAESQRFVVWLHRVEVAQARSQNVAQARSQKQSDEPLQQQQQGLKIQQPP